MSKLRLNTSMHLQTFDSTDRVPMMLCEVPTGSPDTLARYVIARPMLELLQQFDGNRETTEIIDTFCAARPTPVPRSHVESLLHDYCIPHGLLVPAVETAGQARAAASSNRHRYLSIKVQLIPARIVKLMSVPLSVLFALLPFGVLVPAFVASHVIFYRHVMSNQPFDITKVTGADFVILMMLTSAIGIFHELGHAAALARYGHCRAEIGWGVYIISTVLYTDLSDAWRLTRSQRAIVDLGGIYFHLISLIGVLALSLLTSSPIWAYCFLFIDFQIVSSLNPFLRMDGYWLVLDLFGVTNLRRQSLGYLERWLYALFKVNALPIFPVRRLESRAARLLGVYSGASAVLFFYFLYFVLQQLILRLIPHYPLVLMTLWREVRHPTSVLMLVDAFMGAVWKGAALVGFGLFLSRLLIELGLAAARIATNIVCSRQRTCDTTTVV